MVKKSKYTAEDEEDNVKNSKKKTNKKEKKVSSHVPSNVFGTMALDPMEIYFTHSRIRPFFTGCNKRIEETLQEILTSKTSLLALPKITVLCIDGQYFSLNNRRLYLMKELRKQGFPFPVNGTKIEVTMKPPLEREITRYSPSRCSMTAKIMREHKMKTEGKDHEDDNDSIDSNQEKQDVTNEIEDLEKNLTI